MSSNPSLLANSLVSPLRGAVRRLVRAPAYSLTTLLGLGLGFAVLAATAAVTDAFLLRPLPFAEPGQLVSIWKTFDDEASAGLRFFLKPDDFDIVRRELRQVEVAAIKAVDADVVAGEAAQRAAAAWVTADLAPLLGMGLSRGRFFTRQEERDGTAVAVVAESWWRQRWGAAEALGASLGIDGRPYTVVGVLRDELSFPDAVDLWAPLRKEDWEGRLGLSVVGRLASGAGLDAAREEVVALGRRLREIDANLYATAGLDAEPLQAALTVDLRPTLLGLTIAAAAFWLIALANGAALSAARGYRGRADAALRRALGAGFGSLCRQTLSELGLLVASAGVLGLAIARLCLPTLLALSPVRELSFAPVGIDLRVFAAAAALAAVTTVTLAAVHLVVVAAGSDRSGGGPTRSASVVRHRRVLSALVVADLAITAVLLLSAVHAWTSVRGMLTAEAGLRAEGLVAARLSASPSWSETHAQRVAFVSRSLEEVGSLPGVSSVAAVHALPMTQPEYYWSFRVVGRADDAGAEVRDVVLFRAIAGDYFASLGMRVLSGRDLRSSDTEGGARVAWVNHAFAARYWPEEPALGRQLVSSQGGDPWQVVGVVNDVLERGLATPAEPCVYWPMAQYDRRYLSRMQLLIRTRSSVAELLPSLRRRLHGIDVEAVLSDVRPMGEVVVESIRRERFARLLLALCALLATVQAAAGVFGLTGYVVASRRRELGVRVALGASRRGLARLVLSDGLRQAALGFSVGAAVAALLNQLVSASWQVGRIPPAIYGGVAALLVVTVVVAASPAARRATRADPVVSLAIDP